LALALSGLSKSRIEALADGIFASVMTVLILSLSIPTMAASNQATQQNLDVLKYVSALGPVVLAYVMSFLILGVFWVRHHNAFHFISKVDNTFIWLNITFSTNHWIHPVFYEASGKILPCRSIVGDLCSKFGRDRNLHAGECGCMPQDTSSW
jgi:uncharacterized membrane protein